MAAMASSIPQQIQSSVDWQTTKQTVRDRIAFLFNNSLMSDIKFVVTDSDGTQVRLPAHKLVLAIGSPVFEVMFYGLLAEKGEEIELKDMDAESLLEFLRFIYCDEVNLTTDNVLGVLNVAKKYIVPTLASKCRLFLDECADEINACQILEEARRFEESELEERCWEIIDGDPSTCLESDRVLSLSRDTLVSLLKRDTLFAEEIILFEASKRWAEAKCDEKGLEKTDCVIREILGNILDLIRFPIMSQEQFARNVVPTGVMTSEDALQVHQFFLEVIPAANVKFSCAMRVHGLPLERCCRFTKNCLNVMFEFNEATEKLIFMTDKDIFFKGVCIEIGNYRVNNVKAMVRVLTENSNTQIRMVEQNFTVVSGGNMFSTSAFDVLLKVSARLKAFTKYVILTSVRVIGKNSMSKLDRVRTQTVHCAGVNFTFEETSGTDVAQIAELLFHTFPTNSVDGKN